MRTVVVKFLGGSNYEVKAEYLKPDLRGRRGRKRQRRRKGGTGFYPMLVALGISFGVTPALVSEVCRQITDSDSLKAGRQALERRGIILGHNKTLNLFNNFGKRATQQRDDWSENMQSQSPGKTLEGKRVVVGTDGGRLKIRTTFTRGRRRKSGRRGFKIDWKEPKILVLYVIDEKGKIAADFRPVYDGSTENSDVIFSLILGYLKALGAQYAEKVIIVSDGAKWIWSRIEDLRQGLGIDSERLVQIIDKYHAVQKLYKVIEHAYMPANRNHKSWMKKAKKFLHSGTISWLIVHIRNLCNEVENYSREQGLDKEEQLKKVNEVGKHIDYFKRNSERMQYKDFKAMNLPIGSGAVESAVRRIINLRLKGNAKYWLDDNAKTMLLFRSYLKAERFDDLMDWSISTAALWWTQNSGNPLGIELNQEEIKHKSIA